MKEESYRLEKQISSLQKKLATMPQGKLICAKNGNRYKWYQSDGHQKIYIPKKNRKVAEQLAKKKYLSFLLEDLLHEKRAIDFYLDIMIQRLEKQKDYLQRHLNIKNYYPHFLKVNQKS